jgi:hypothetical protein
MKPISRMVTASAAALCTFAFVAMATPPARAGEFCMTDSSAMRSCGFATLEQCKASASGKNGSCARDPFYDNANSGNTNSGNTNSALAYQPKQTHSRSKLRPAKPPAVH